jgi:hypothetical protein
VTTAAYSINIQHLNRGKFSGVSITADFHFDFSQNLSEVSILTLRRKRFNQLSYKSKNPETVSLLIFDNRHCVHARSFFNAEFDGQARWLRRMHIVRSLEPSACDRKNGSRIINTDLGDSWN